MTRRILIADDDADLLGMLDFYLRKQGYEVVSAEDGEQALALTRDSRFDLVLLDVMMPKLDGYHVAQQLAEKLGQECPKILIMTSRDVERERGIALACGASATIQKPIKLGELRDKIVGLL